MFRFCVRQKCWFSISSIRFSGNSYRQTASRYYRGFYFPRIPQVTLTARFAFQILYTDTDCVYYASTSLNLEDLVDPKRLKAFRKACQGKFAVRTDAENIAKLSKRYGFFFKKNFFFCQPVLSQPPNRKRTSFVLRAMKYEIQSPLGASIGIFVSAKQYWLLECLEGMRGPNGVTKTIVKQKGVSKIEWNE